MQSSPQAATPTFSTTGLVLIGTVITISDSTPGFITITYCFDTNNTCTPSTVGTSYTVTTAGYLRAFATASGFTQSTTASAQYTVYVVSPATNLMAQVN